MAFKKGISGNPGGRPKAAFDVQACARKRTKKNLDNLAHWADQKDDGAIAVRANIALHEIAWGKPAQQVTADVTHQAGDTLTTFLLALRNGHEG